MTINACLGCGTRTGTGTRECPLCLACYAIVTAPAPVPPPLPAQIQAAQAAAVHELRARIASNAALLAARQAFQDRWGNYFKCAVCGGRIDAMRDLVVATYTGKKCMYGDHVCAVMENGYSWTRP